MGIEERELLMTMHAIERVVDVEPDRPGRPIKAGAEEIDHRRHHPRNLDLSRRVLEPRHGRLRAQRRAAPRQSPHRHLEHRVGAQAVAIVGVLIARRDQQHPPTQHLHHFMVDAPGVAPIDKTVRQPLGDTEASFHISQHQHAAIRGQQAAVEGHAHFLAADGWQRERQKVIVIHGGCGVP